MRLELFQNKDIDKNSWDQFISQSAEGNFYALSWYLDIVCLGWSGLFVWDNDSLIAICPLDTKKKLLFLSTIHQPYFTQQLGIFTNGTVSANEVYEVVSSYLKNKFQYIDYHFNCDNTEVFNSIPQGKELIPRLTHHLYLNFPYDILRKAFSENQKRSVKKALRNNLHVSVEQDFEPLSELFIATKGKELPELKAEHYQNIQAIYTNAQARGMTCIYATRNAEGELLSAALFVRFRSKIVYLFGASSEKGKESGSMALLFDQFISDHSNSELVLDFEGSNIPSLARFYKGFGGKEAIYLRLKKSFL